MPIHFVEKDWYITELLRHIMAFEPGEGLRFVFTGGTSLSKARNVLERFSEDVDFVVEEREGVELTRSQRRALRERFFTHLSEGSHFSITPSADGKAPWKSRDDSRFFSVELTYPRKAAREHSALRPIILLEVSFQSPPPPVETATCRSMVDALTGEQAPVSIPCKSVVQIAGDKLSALCWRVLSRDRTSATDDPTIVRHLHDLAILRPLIEAEFTAFEHFALSALAQDIDRRRGGLVDKPSSTQRLRDLLTVLATDPLYPQEYQRYVESMSYQAIDEIFGYAEALAGLTSLVTPLGLLSRGRSRA